MLRVENVRRPTTGRAAGVFVWISTALVACLAIADEQGDKVEVRSGFVQVGDERLFYEEAGKGAGVVMIHGGLLHRVSWDPQFHELAKHYRVVRYDRRGCGKSSIPKAKYSDIDDLGALLKHLKLDRVTLVGCSYGGLIAVHYALDHPDTVAALVLAGPVTTGLPTSEHFQTRGGRGRPSREAALEERIEYWTMKDPWMTSSENKDVRRFMQRVLREHPQNLSLNTRLIQFPKSPAVPRLKKISAATLILVGESDIPEVHAHAGALQAGIKGAKRIVLSRAGHMVQLERPQAVNKAVTEFVGQVFNLP